MAESIKQVLMSRDGLTWDEAEERIDEVVDQLNEILSEGGSLEEVDQMLMDELGLEPDYFEELLDRLTLYPGGR